MKRTTKVGMTGIVSGILLAGMLGACQGEVQETEQVKEELVVVEKAEAEKPKTEKPKAKEVTKEESLPGLEEYEQLQDQMTREEVESILGKVDIVLESESETEGITSAAVSYKAEGSIGANIVVIYGNGVLISKAQTGL